MRHEPFDAGKLRSLLAEQVEGRWRAKHVPTGQHRVQFALFDAMRLWMAGAPEAAEELLHVVTDWAGVVEPDVSQYPDRMYGLFMRHYTLAHEFTYGAIALWMLTGDVPVDLLERSLDEWGRARTAELTRSAARMDKLHLDEFMAAGVLAGADARAVEMFERESPAPIASLSVGRARSPRALGALIAIARLAGRDPAPLAA